MCLLVSGQERDKLLSLLWLRHCIQIQTRLSKTCSVSLNRFLSPLPQGLREEVLK